MRCCFSRYSQGAGQRHGSVSGENRSGSRNEACSRVDRGLPPARGAERDRTRGRHQRADRRVAVRHHRHGHGDPADGVQRGSRRTDRGSRRDEVLGKEVPDLLVPERERARFLAQVKTFRDTSEPGEFTGRMRVSLLRADGTEHVAELIPVQVTVKGKTTFWGVLRDPTEAERLNEQRAM